MLILHTHAFGQQPEVQPGLQQSQPASTSCPACSHSGSVEFLSCHIAEAAAACRSFPVADTMAHEMAHLWCGDLVTMAWWSDLWLNARRFPLTPLQHLKAHLHLRAQRSARDAWVVHEDGISLLKERYTGQCMLAAISPIYRTLSLSVVQEACATVFEYFGAGYASVALQGVGTFFYATADVLPFGDDFAGGTQHPISDPSNSGGFRRQVPGAQPSLCFRQRAWVLLRVQTTVLQCTTRQLNLGSAGRLANIMMYTHGAPYTKQMCEALHCCRCGQRRGGPGPV